MAIYFSLATSANSLATMMLRCCIHNGNLVVRANATRRDFYNLYFLLRTCFLVDNVSIPDPNLAEIQKALHCPVVHEHEYLLPFPPLLLSERHPV